MKPTLQNVKHFYMHEATHIGQDVLSDRSYSQSHPPVRGKAQITMSTRLETVKEEERHLEGGPNTLNEELPTLRPIKYVFCCL